MKLEEEIEKDLVIDPTSLETEAATNPIKHFKYIRKLKETKLKVKILENRLKQKRRDRFLYYIGKHDTDVCDVVYEKSEIKVVLEGDKHILAIESELYIAEQEVKLLEMTCDVFKARGFSIKHMIDNRILESGR